MRGIHQKQQRWTRTERGNGSWGKCAPIPAAHKAQVHGRSDLRRSGVLLLTNLAGLWLGHFSISRLRGCPSCLRIGDRLLPSLTQPVAVLSSGGPRGERFTCAPLYRPLHLNTAHHIACKLADVPECHSSNAFRGGCFDAVHSTRRLIANDQFIVGEIRNV